MKQPEILVASAWVRSVIAAVIAIVLWRLVDAGITKFYARRFVSRFIPRVPTYTSMTKSLSGVIILFFLILELLNIWKVNVTPALWSAGALGIIIGIGAQAIVRDVLTGALYLFEDAFDVGDGVELTTTNGIVTGVVEAVGLREARIVDERGYVVSVPYGSIVFVANATRLPLRLNMRFSLPLSDNVAALRERIARLAHEAVKKAGVEVDGLAVVLDDVKPDSATFKIAFQTNRKDAHVAESSLRESIATNLQAEGLLPGIDQRESAVRAEGPVGRIHSTAPSAK